VHLEGRAGKIAPPPEVVEDLDKPMVDTGDWAAARHRPVDVLRQKLPEAVLGILGAPV